MRAAVAGVFAFAKAEFFRRHGMRYRAAIDAEKLIDILKDIDYGRIRPL